MLWHTYLCVRASLCYVPRTYFFLFYLQTLMSFVVNADKVVQCVYVYIFIHLCTAKCHKNTCKWRRNNNEGNFLLRNWKINKMKINWRKRRKIMISMTKIGNFIIIWTAHHKACAHKKKLNLMEIKYQAETSRYRLHNQ